MSSHRITDVITEKPSSRTSASKYRHMNASSVKWGREKSDRRVGYGVGPTKSSLVARGT